MEGRGDGDRQKWWRENQWYMEFCWITSQVERPGQVREGRFGRGLSSVLGLHNSVIPTRYPHENTYLESRRYLVQINMGNLRAQSQNMMRSHREGVQTEKTQDRVLGAQTFQVGGGEGPEKEQSRRSMFTEYTFIYIKNFLVSQSSSASTFKRVRIFNNKEITKCKSNNSGKTQFEQT